MADSFDIGGPSILDYTSRKSKRRKKSEILDVPESPSLMGRAGGAALSGLAAVGNTLDLPGSMVRDVLGGENPLDQLLSPWRSDNRLSGRDLLRKHGLVGQKDTWGNWAGGFATELATDPLTYVGLGALAKGASAGLVGGSKVATAAAKPGAGLLRVGIPFLKSSARDIFTGPQSVKAAQFLGKQAERVGLSKPMLAATSLLDASRMGRMTPEGQAIAEGVFNAQKNRHADVLGTTGEVARSLETSGKATATHGVDLRRELELGGTSKESSILRKSLDDINRTKTSMGIGLGPLDDVIDKATGRKLGYAPRKINEEIVRSAQGTRSPLSGKSADDAARLLPLKGFREGTEGVNKLFSDATLKSKATQWMGAIDAAQAANNPTLAKSLRKQAIDDLRQHIDTNFGSAIEGTYDITKGGKTKSVDRLKKLATIALTQPKWFEHTLFPNHPLVDIEQHLITGGDKIEAAKGLFDGLGNLAKQFDPATKGDTTTISSILKSLGFKKAALDQMAQRLGVTAKEAAKMRVNKNIAGDLMGLWPNYAAPKQAGALLNTVDSFQSLFKAGVLTWPARYVRDAMSGAYRNFERGWLDPDSFVKAHRVIQGRTVTGLLDAPAVKSWLANKGLPATDENATEAVRQMYGQYFTGGTAHSDVLNAVGTDPKLESILSRIPGRKPTNALQNAADVLKTAAGRTPGTTLNPTDVRGFNFKTASKFGPVAAGEKVGKYTDQLNRLSPFINQLKAGADPAQAAKAINDAQVDYSARNFTPTERILKRLMPFYSFSKQQAIYVAKELLSNPGGRLGATVRASRLAHNPDDQTPDYVAESASIPLGTAPDGTKRFITGLGLMHEDPLSFLGGGVRGAGLEALSRGNPLLKGPLEWATGQSFFQKGPEGGRPLEDMDPTIGRTLANLTGSDRPVMFPGSQAIEAIAGNSPLSRLLTTGRQLTDKRKGIGAKAANMLTGVRIADVSPAVQDSLLREQAQKILKSYPEARTYTQTFVPKDEWAKLAPDERLKVQELTTILNVLSKRAQRRAEQKKLLAQQKK